MLSARSHILSFFLMRCKANSSIAQAPVNGDRQQIGGPAEAARIRVASLHFPSFLSQCKRLVIVAGARHARCG